MTSSVTVCSTCRRGFASMKANPSPAAPSTRNSTVATLSSPAARASATAASSSASRRSRRQAGRRGDLDELLPLPLDAALALPQVDHAAGGVADHLHLDVAGARQERLDVDVAVAERLERLRAAARVRAVELARVRHRAHPPPAAARDRLDHHAGAAARGEERARLVEARRPRRRGQHRHAAALREGARARLVAERLEHRGAGAHEREPGRGAAAREARLLAEEAVARVHRVAPRLARRGHDLLGVEVRGGPGAGERARLVGAARVERGGVVLGVHRHRGEPVLRGRARDADRDLAAIGDQELREAPAHAVPSLCRCHACVPSIACGPCVSPVGAAPSRFRGVARRHRGPGARRAAAA